MFQKTYSFFLFFFIIILSFVKHKDISFENIV